MKNMTVFGLLCLLSVMVIGVVNVSAEEGAKTPVNAPVDPSKIKDIKAYCLAQKPTSQLIQQRKAPGLTIQNRQH